MSVVVAGRRVSEAGRELETRLQGDWRVLESESQAVQVESLNLVTRQSPRGAAFHATGDFVDKIVGEFLQFGELVEGRGNEAPIPGSAGHLDGEGEKSLKPLEVRIAGVQANFHRRR